MNNDRPIHTTLLLQHGMRMIPIRSRLFYSKFILQHLSRLDRRSSQIGNSVIKIRQYYPVPMNRCFHSHLILHINNSILSFRKFQYRTRYASIYSHSFYRYSCFINYFFPNGQCIFFHRKIINVTFYCLTKNRLGYNQN